MDTNADHAAAPPNLQARHNPGNPWLRVDSSASPQTGTTRLRLTGELDRTTCVHLRWCVTEALSDPIPVTLVLDAAMLSFLDSSGIRCLLACRTDAEGAGARLIVADPSVNAYQVLEITGLLDVFGVPRRAQPARTGKSRRQPGEPTITLNSETTQYIRAQAVQLRQQSRAIRERAAAMRGDNAQRRLTLPDFARYPVPKASDGGPQARSEFERE